MNKKTLKCIAKCFFCGVMLCMFAVWAACSKGEINSGTVREGSVPDSNIMGKIPADTGAPVKPPKEQEWVYVSERVEIAGQRADYDHMNLIGGTACYISRVGEAEDEQREICWYSLADRELRSVPIDWMDDGVIRDAARYVFDENQNVFLIANVYSAGYRQFRQFLYKFDAEGKNIFCKEITEQLGSGASINGMAVDGQGRIYIFEGKTGIYLYHEDGSYQAMIPYHFSEETKNQNMPGYDFLRQIQILGTAEGTDGRFFACVKKGRDAERCALLEIDFEGKKFLELIGDFTAVNGFCKDADGKYDFLLFDDTFAYGYRLAAQEREELFAWTDSDINGYFVTDLCALGDNRYFCAVSDWEHDDRSLAALSKTKAEEAPRRQELVLATVDGESDLASMVVAFNRNSSEYHITLKKYDSLTHLYNAILTKASIDIIDLSKVNAANLCRQGILEDMSLYLEQSEIFERTDFVDGILKAYTFDGMLAGIPETFMLRTVVGDGSRLGNKSGLTLDEFLAIAERNSEAQPFVGVTREEIMEYLVIFNEHTFIDWETGKCYFDSEQFKAVLEFAAGIPKTIEEDENEKSVPLKVRDGEVLFDIANFQNVTGFQKYRGIFGENAACIGFPTADGKGGTLLFGDSAFGIAATSKYKSGAWNFIESVLKRKNTDGMSNEEINRAYNYYPPRHLPVLKKDLRAIKEYIIEGDKEREKTGTFPTIHYGDGWSFTYSTLTEEEVNAILDLIPYAAPYYSLEDNAVIRIINEEAESYYSAQKSAEAVAGIIQKRVQIYVDENR